MVTSTVSNKGPSRLRKEYVAGLRVLGHSGVYYFCDRLDRNGRFLVGRTNQRELRIRCRSVSRKHCEIVQFGPGQFMMRDLQSTNGVRVAIRGHYGPWVQCQEVVLVPGMHIKLGRAVVVPVDPRGECPVMARDHVEFAKHIKMTYGSATAAESFVGRGRQWIDDVIRKAMRVLL